MAPPKEVAGSLKDRLASIRSYFGKRRGRKRRKIALLVDGPNMLRKEFEIDLGEIKEMLRDFGDIRVGKVFLNQFASEKLIQAVENQGFEVVISTSDVDVPMAIAGMEMIYNDNIDTLALVTRDTDFKPLVLKAREKGKTTIVFGAEEGLSHALKNAADYVVVLKKNKEFEILGAEEG
ncbi:MAG: TIGR00288 family NYN domain-containing protein [Archaeoglobi archaeon]|nr:TIGR00288 family NYN domain-containing protein [Candidatus Mnemosynella bozhongmuii]